MSYISGSLSGVLWTSSTSISWNFFEMYILGPPPETLGLGPTTHVFSSLQVSLMHVKVSELPDLHNFLHSSQLQI